MLLPGRQCYLSIRRTISIISSHRCFAALASAIAIAPDTDEEARTRAHGAARAGSTNISIDKQLRARFGGIARVRCIDVGVEYQYQSSRWPCY